MRKLLTSTASLALGVSLVCVGVPAQASWFDSDGRAEAAQSAPEQIAQSGLRVATVDAELSGADQGQLAIELASGTDRRATRLADHLTEANPDIVVLTGMDTEQSAVDALRANYLNNPFDDRADLNLPYSYLAPGTTGVQSGADLDADGVVGGPNDAWGAGDYEGQGGLVVLSRYPIDPEKIISITALPWHALPGDRPKAAGLDGVLAGAIPVMSGGLWDIPIDYRGETVHLLAAQMSDQPAGVSFAGQRQQDQLRVLADYFTGAAYVRDDAQRPVHAQRDEPVIVAGDLGSMPQANAARAHLLQVLHHGQDAAETGAQVLADHSWSTQEAGSVGAPAQPDRSVTGIEELLPDSGQVRYLDLGR